MKLLNTLKMTMMLPSAALAMDSIDNETIQEYVTSQDKTLANMHMVIQADSLKNHQANDTTFVINAAQLPSNDLGYGLAVNDSIQDKHLEKIAKVLSAKLSQSKLGDYNLSDLVSAEDLKTILSLDSTKKATFFQLVEYNFKDGYSIDIKELEKKSDTLNQFNSFTKEIRSLNDLGKRAATEMRFAGNGNSINGYNNNVALKGVFKKLGVEQNTAATWAMFNPNAYVGDQKISNMFKDIAGKDARIQNVLYGTASDKEKEGLFTLANKVSSLINYDNQSSPLSNEQKTQAYDNIVDFTYDFRIKKYSQSSYKSQVDRLSQSLNGGRLSQALMQESKIGLKKADKVFGESVRRNLNTVLGGDKLSNDELGPAAGFKGINAIAVLGTHYGDDVAQTIAKYAGNLNALNTPLVDLMKANRATAVYEAVLPHIVNSNENIDLEDAKKKFTLTDAVKIALLPIIIEQRQVLNKDITITLDQEEHELSIPHDLPDLTPATSLGVYSFVENAPRQTLPNTTATPFTTFGFGIEGSVPFNGKKISGNINFSAGIERGTYYSQDYTMDLGSVSVALPDGKNWGVYKDSNGNLTRTNDGNFIVSHDGKENLGSFDDSTIANNNIPLSLGTAGFSQNIDYISIASSLGTDLYLKESDIGLSLDVSGLIGPDAQRLTVNTSVSKKNQKNGVFSVNGNAFTSKTRLNTQHDYTAGQNNSFYLLKNGDYDINQNGDLIVTPEVIDETELEIRNFEIDPTTITEQVPIMEDVEIIELEEYEVTVEEDYEVTELEEYEVAVTESVCIPITEIKKTPIYDECNVLIGYNEIEVIIGYEWVDRPVLDENGQAVTETQTREVTRIETREVIKIETREVTRIETVPALDEDGNPITRDVTTNVVDNDGNQVFDIADQNIHRTSTQELSYWLQKTTLKIDELDVQAGQWIKEHGAGLGVNYKAPNGLTFGAHGRYAKQNLPNIAVKGHAQLTQETESYHKEFETLDDNASDQLITNDNNDIIGINQGNGIINAGNESFFTTTTTLDIPFNYVMNSTVSTTGVGASIGYTDANSRFAVNAFTTASFNTYDATLNKALNNNFETENFKNNYNLYRVGFNTAFPITSHVTGSFGTSYNFGDAQFSSGLGGRFNAQAGIRINLNKRGLSSKKKKELEMQKTANELFNSKEKSNDILENIDTIEKLKTKTTQNSSQTQLKK